MGPNKTSSDWEIQMLVVAIIILWGTSTWVLLKARCKKEMNLWFNPDVLVAHYKNERAQWCQNRLPQTFYASAKIALGLFCVIPQRIILVDHDDGYTGITFWSPHTMFIFNKGALIKKRVLRTRGHCAMQTICDYCENVFCTHAATGRNVFQNHKKSWP